MRINLTIAISMLLGFGLGAQTVTWSDHVAPVVYKHCASCHRDGGIAPFSLMSYQEAAPQASYMAWAVEQDIMPPWPPNPSYQPHAFQRVLSPAERQAIIDWAAQGAPPGNLANAPSPPTFPDGGELVGTPDLVLQIPTYVSQATDHDDYRCFVFKSPVDVDRYVVAWEVVPGNRSIVHHVVAFKDDTGNCAARDEQTPEPGYVCFGGACQDAEIFGAWAPGGNALVYPPGMGIKLNAGTDIVVQLHYPAGSVGQVDSTRINLFFAPLGQPMREVKFATVADPFFTNLNKPFVIPANQVKTFNTRLELNYGLDFSLLRVFPHMHLLGKSMKAWVKLPDGHIQPLIHIPEWHFEWQGAYAFPNLLKVPDGSVIETQFTYDNTTANPHNPHNPPQPVTYGEETTDEMLYLFLEYAIYQPGDEFIYLDSSFLTDTHEPVHNPTHDIDWLAVRPNPVTAHFFVDYEIVAPGRYDLLLFDAIGRPIGYVFKSSLHQPGRYRIPVEAELSAGLYHAILRSERGAQKAVKFVVLKNGG